MKKKAQRNKNKALKLQLRNARVRISNLVEELDEIYENQQGDADFEKNQMVRDIHQQIVYQGQDPLDVLDDLMREHGFIWSKAAA